MDYPLAIAFTVPEMRATATEVPGHREIADVERVMLRKELTDERRSELLGRLAKIEQAIVSRRLPGSHVEQVYILRQHIDMVRKKLTAGGTAPISIV
jgi:hypothetical protein